MDDTSRGRGAGQVAPENTMKTSTLKKKQRQVLSTPEFRALFAVPRVPETTFSVRVPLRVLELVRLASKRDGKLQQRWVAEALEEALAAASNSERTTKDK